MVAGRRVVGRVLRGRHAELVRRQPPRHEERLARDVRDKAYVAWLGHTNAKAKALGWSKQELVDRANAMAVDDYLYKTFPEKYAAFRANFPRNADGTCDVSGVPGPPPGGPPL